MCQIRATNRSFFNAQASAHGAGRLPPDRTLPTPLKAPPKHQVKHGVSSSISILEPESGCSAEPSKVKPLLKKNQKNPRFPAKNNHQFFFITPHTALLQWGRSSYVRIVSSSQQLYQSDCDQSAECHQQAARNGGYRYVPRPLLGIARCDLHWRAAGTSVVVVIVA
jgi:hypothetical protein